MYCYSSHVTFYDLNFVGQNHYDILKCTRDNVNR